MTTGFYYSFLVTAYDAITTSVMTQIQASIGDIQSFPIHIKFIFCENSSRNIVNDNRFLQIVILVQMFDTDVRR